MTAAVRAHSSIPVRSSSRQSRRVTQEAQTTRSKPDAVVETTIETTSKLIIQGLLGCVTIAALGSLIPLAQTDTAKLKELSQELNATQQRVGHLQQQLNYYFDPQQARSITQEAGNRVGRNEAPIILIQP